MQDISQKTMFDEVYKNQLKIIEDKEKEIRASKAEEMRLKQLETTEKLKVEKKKREEAYNLKD